MTYEVEQQTDNTVVSSEKTKIEELMAENGALQSQVEKSEREKIGTSLSEREKQNKVWKKNMYKNTKLKV